MSLTSIARRHAAKILVALAKEEPPTSDVEAKAVAGQVEVIVTIRPVRYSPTSDLDQTIADLRARGFEVAPLTPSGAPVPDPIPAIELSEPERRVLAALSVAPATARAIARKAGYSSRTGKIRVILPALVRMGLAIHVPGEGYKLA